MRKIKIAIISDIHGNIVALNEVIKDAEKNNVDDYVFLGDLVNDLPFGNETLKIVREKSNKVIKGNKEQYLIEYEKYKYDWKNLQFRNVKFMYNELLKENMDFIRVLPHYLEIEFEGVKILFAHGSPKSVEELLNKNKRELLEKYANEIDANALIFGHTHEKMWYEYINGKLIMIAGCCGVSPNYIGKAEYVILEIEEKNIKNINLKLVDYDINLVKQKIINSGILDEDKVFMNLTYSGISGKSDVRYNFLYEAKKLHIIHINTNKTKNTSAHYCEKVQKDVFFQKKSICVRNIARTNRWKNVSDRKTVAR